MTYQPDKFGENQVGSPTTAQSLFFCVVLAARKRYSWLLQALASSATSLYKDAWCGSFLCPPSHLFGPPLVAATSAVIQVHTQIAETSPAPPLLPPPPSRACHKSFHFLTSLGL